MRSAAGLVATITASALLGSACAGKKCDFVRGEVGVARPVVVVAPVLNLSGSPDIDPIKLTDIVASEFQSFSVSVVPVNLTLAALDRRGKTCVETPADALELAREFGADATVVTAVTEFDPYDPPIVGLVMQWYTLSGQQAGGASGSAGAPGNGAEAGGAGLSAAAAAQPRFQVQRVFNAADNKVLEEVREFASRREGAQSAYGWRQHIQSQELYVRYCCWAVIRTIGLQDAGFSAAAPSKVSG